MIKNKLALLDQYGKVMKLGYDATQRKAARRAPRVAIKSEDDELGKYDRQKLIATSKDQVRNIALVSWMYRKHLDYVSQFTFHAMTGNARKDKILENLWREYSKKTNCDIARRHSLNRIIRMFEAGKVIDGDCGLYKVNNGKLQGIEGARIAKPDRKKPTDKTKIEKINDHGLILDQYGAVDKYSITTLDNGTKLFEKFITYDNLIFDGYFSRFNQTRGISPLASALNIFQDLYEATEYALIKAKIHAMFGVAIMSDTVSSEGDGFYNYDSVTGTTPTSDTQENGYQFDLKYGLKLELEPGDKIDTIESKTPSTEFKEYTELMIRIGMLALDIPYTFYNSSGANFSSMKQDRVEYELSAKSKKEANQEALNMVADWKHQEWIDKGLLKGFSNANEIKYNWRASGQPWLEELKEIDAAAKRIDVGLSSRQLEAKKRGLDWYELMEQRKEEDDYIKANDIIITSGAPGQSSIQERESNVESSEE
jgi:capsid protein